MEHRVRNVPSLDMILGHCNASNLFTAVDCNYNIKRINISPFSVRFPRWPLCFETLRTQIVYAFVAVALSTYSEHPCVRFDDANSCLFTSLRAAVSCVFSLAYHYPSLFPSSGRLLASIRVKLALCT